MITQAMMQSITKEVKKVDTYGDAAKIKTFLNLLYIGEITKEEVEKQLSGAQYAKAKKQIEDVYTKYLKNHAEEWRKKMIESGKPICVIWMYGKPGTGKTSFAKEYAKKAGNGQPFYVAGSSRDIFQSYMGEHIIILDELRTQSIPYPDLLRILDPFGIDAQVYAPSRYFDKALAADLIIITTPYSPLDFYYEVFGYKVGLIDSFEQLHRRISLTLAMTTQKYLRQLMTVINNAILQTRQVAAQTHIRLQAARLWQSARRIYINLCLIDFYLLIM